MVKKIKQISCLVKSYSRKFLNWYKKSLSWSITNSPKDIPYYGAQWRDLTSKLYTPSVVLLIGTYFRSKNKCYQKALWCLMRHCIGAVTKIVNYLKNIRTIFNQATWYIKICLHPFFYFIFCTTLTLQKPSWLKWEQFYLVWI